MEAFDEGALDRMIAEKERLRSERTVADAAAAEADSRRRRLQKQEELLERRFRDAVQKGLSNVEELEKLEREEEEAVMRQRSEAGPSAPLRQEHTTQDPLDPSQIFAQADLAAFDHLSPSWFGDIGQPSTQLP